MYNLADGTTEEIEALLQFYRNEKKHAKARLRELADCGQLGVRTRTHAA